MNARSKVDMFEVTRLTKLGRLQEAMAVLRGGSVSPGSSPRFADDPQPERVPSTRLLKGPPAAAESEAGRTAPRWKHFAAAADVGATRRPQIPEAIQDLLRRLRPSATGNNGFVMPGQPRGASVAVPPGARFEEHAFSNAAGHRSYKLYVPSRYAGQPIALVVMLHGCTQSPDDFAAGTQMNGLAEEQVFLVAYPAQPQSANPSKCWNWFCAGDQQRDRGEPSLIAGLTREIMREFPVTPGAVYVAGLSAGGAAAAIMGATYPDLYAAVGVHSGLACGAASDMASAFAAMKQGAQPQHQPRSARNHPMPTIVFHGDRDQIVSPINADQVVDQSRANASLSTTVTRGTSAGGMAYTRTVEADASGRPVVEHWRLHGAGHAWSGGSSAGSYTDPRGPDASREIVRFFFQQGLATPENSTA